MQPVLNAALQLGTVKSEYIDVCINISPSRLVKMGPDLFWQVVLKPIRECNYTKKTSQKDL